MSMRPAALLRRAEDYLSRHGVENPRGDAEVLLADVLGTDRAGIYARAEPLAPDQARAFGLALCQRCEGVPLQHLTGDQPFRGLVLEVRPGVFVPRPETEVLVDVALERIADRADPLVVDVGTGTGAIALSIASQRPTARVLAIDVSPEAVDLARANSERLALAIDVCEGEYLDAVPAEHRGSIDLVVSNPPYVTPEEYSGLPTEVLADPVVALVGGVGVYERLCSDAVQWLRPGGWLVVEIGASQGPEVAAIFAGSLADVEVIQDLAGRDRIVVGRLP
jgi:release factor glutamine methyltransferase